MPSRPANSFLRSAGAALALAIAAFSPQSHAADPTTMRIAGNFSSNTKHVDEIEKPFFIALPKLMGEPIAINYNPMDYSIIDAVYLKNNSYVRIKSIILTYSLPSEAVKKLRMRGLSFNISMNNFFTFTGYDGMDPEIPGATYPTTRSVSGGINVEF